MSPYRPEPSSAAGRRLTTSAGWVAALLAGVALLAVFRSGPDSAELLSVAAAPAAVTLTFDRPVDAAGSHVTVTGADGVDVGAGPVRAAGSGLMRPVRAAPGAYLVAYHVTFAGGGELAGSSRLTVGDAHGAAAPAAAAGHAHDPAGLATLVPLVVVTVVVVAAVAAYGRARRRYRRTLPG